MTGITAEDFKRLAKQATAELAAEKEAARLAAPAPVATPSPAAPGSVEEQRASILSQAAAIEAAAEEQAKLADAARLVLTQEGHGWAGELDDDLALEAVGLAVDQAKLDSDARDAAIRAEPHRDLKKRWWSLSEGQRKEACSAEQVSYEEFSAERAAAAAGGRIFS